MKSLQLPLPVSAIATRVNWSALVKSESTRVALLVFASILPGVALWNHATFLFGDSYQYLRAALTFAQGQGLRDMSGNQFTFLTPLYPIVTGIAYALIPGVGIVTTARLVSLIGGTGAVLAFYWLLRGRYSLQVAFVTSLLFALMPLRVWSSLWVLSEGLYLGLLMLGVALLFRDNSISALRSLLGGAAFGLAYLTRPESILYLAGMVVLLLIGVLRAKKRRMVPVLVMAGFLAMALPYHAWVHHVSDSLTSGRLSLLFVQAESFRQGQGPQFVYSHEVDQQGESIRQHVPDLSVRAVLSRYAFFAVWETKRLAYDLGPTWIVLGLFVVGFILFLFGKVGSATSLDFSDMWQFLLPLMLIVLPFLHIEDRYLLQVMPAFLLWLVLIVLATNQVVASKSLHYSKRLAGFVPLAFVILFVLSYGSRLMTQIPQRDSSALARSTALWCQSQKLSPAPILSQTPDLAFFSSAQHLWMPNGEPGHVVTYAQRNGARYIYVSSQDVPTPLNDLLLGNSSRIPASLKLLHEESDGPARGRLFEVNSNERVISSNLHL